MKPRAIGVVRGFLSVDTLTSSYPMLTPYQFASNTPIQAVDLDGLEAYRADVLLDQNNRTLAIDLTFDEDLEPIGEGKFVLFAKVVSPEGVIDSYTGIRSMSDAPGLFGDPNFDSSREDGKPFIEGDAHLSLDYGSIRGTIELLDVKLGVDFGARRNISTVGTNTTHTSNTGDLFYGTAGDQDRAWEYREGLMAGVGHTRIEEWKNDQPTGRVRTETNLLAFRRETSFTGEPSYSAGGGLNVALGLGFKADARASINPQKVQPVNLFLQQSAQRQSNSVQTDNAAVSPIVVQE